MPDKSGVADVALCSKLFLSFARMGTTRSLDVAGCAHGALVPLIASGCACTTLNHVLASPSSGTRSFT